MFWKLCDASGIPFVYIIFELPQKSVAANAFLNGFITFLSNIMSNYTFVFVCVLNSDNAFFRQMANKSSSLIEHLWIICKKYPIKIIENVDVNKIKH